MPFSPLGFDPHIDANAYTHVKNIKHLMIPAAVDPMNASNGGLDGVDGSHRMEVPLGCDRCVEPAWVEIQKWTPCDLLPGTSFCSMRFDLELIRVKGDILVFGSYLAHRCGAMARRAIYATYNCAAEGDLHDVYYADRQKLSPALICERRQSYAEGRNWYAFGTPMLTVDGKSGPVIAA